MTKRMKRIAALLTCGLVLASGTSVYAGNAEGTQYGKESGKHCAGVEDGQIF